MNLLQVGAANAATVNLDEHFARPDRGYRNALHPYIVDAVINRSLHGRRQTISKSALLAQFTNPTHQRTHAAAMAIAPSGILAHPGQPRPKARSIATCANKAGSRRCPRLSVYALKSGSVSAATSETAFRQ